MKNLPYYRWYPADAEGDDFYAALTNEELGVYHRCLNRAWMNGGIPADLDVLAGVLKLPRKQLDKIWAKVKQRWQISESDPTKLVNSRQERERTAAIEKGEKNKRPGNANASREKRERVPNANDSRYERDSVERDINANGTQHARARADSGFDSASFGEVIPFNAKKTSPPSERFEEWWALWSAVRGNNHQRQAETVFPREVTVEIEDACMECTRSYLASLDNPSKGFNPENFLIEYSRDKFTTYWKPRSPPRGAYQQQISDAEQAAMIEAFGKTRGL